MRERFLPSRKYNIYTPVMIETRVYIYIYKYKSFYFKLFSAKFQVYIYAHVILGYAGRSECPVQDVRLEASNETLIVRSGLLYSLSLCADFSVIRAYSEFAMSDVIAAARVSALFRVIHRRQCAGNSKSVFLFQNYISVFFYRDPS